MREERRLKGGEDETSAVLILSPLASVPSSNRAGTPSTWLVTFTDLVALMITFFVLLFSMSQVEERKWQNLTNALSKKADLVREVTVALPTEQLDIDVVETEPGADLDYLASVLRRHMADDPLLAEGYVERRADRLIVSLPVDLRFANGNRGLSADATEAIRALGGLLANISNRIEVDGHARPGATAEGFDSPWSLSVARAMRVGVLLSESGYQNRIVVRGLGAARYGMLSPDLTEAQRRVLGRRIDIVIHEDAGERNP